MMPCSLLGNCTVCIRSKYSKGTKLYQDRAEKYIYFGVVTMLQSMCHSHTAASLQCCESTESTVCPLISSTHCWLMGRYVRYIHQNIHLEQNIKQLNNFPPEALLFFQALSVFRSKYEVSVVESGHRTDELCLQTYSGHRLVHAGLSLC